MKLILLIIVLVFPVVAQTQEPVTVEAKEGETLAELARRVGANPKDVAKFNGLRQDAKLDKGRIIAVPPADLKAWKKAWKQKAKAEAEEAEVQRRKITVDFVQLTKFPSSFVGGTRRLYRIGLGDIDRFATRM